MQILTHNMFTSNIYENNMSTRLLFTKPNRVTDNNSSILSHYI